MVSYLKVANFVMIIIAPQLMMMNGILFHSANFNDKRTFVDDVNGLGA